MTFEQEVGMWNVEQLSSYGKNGGWLAVVFFLNVHILAQGSEPIANAAVAQRPTIVLNGRELGPAFDIQRLEQHEQFDQALMLANRVLQMSPTNRYVRLERAALYQRRGDTQNAEKDLSYLLEHYPEFGAAYYPYAHLLLHKQAPPGDKPPLIEWLNSSDERKQRAALSALEEALKEIEKAKLNKTAGTQERTTQEVPKSSAGR